jgi:hypothetical protein
MIGIFQPFFLYLRVLNLAQLCSIDQLIADLQFTKLFCTVALFCLLITINIDHISHPLHYKCTSGADGAL